VATDRTLTLGLDRRAVQGYL